MEKGTPILIPLMTAEATSVAACSTEKMMLEIVHVRIATGVTRTVSVLEHVVEGRLREGYKRLGDEVVDIGIYFRTSRNRQDTVNWKRKH